MTISRIVDGKNVSFELSDSELYRAFLEQEFILDRLDCEDMIAGFSDEDSIGCYGVDAGTFKTLLDDMAVEKRRNMDKYDMSWDYARDEAIRTIIDGYLKGEIVNS